MPFYSQLTIREKDNHATKKKKIRVASQLQKLKKSIEEHIENSRPDHDHKGFVRIATWNLREFGGKKYKGRSYEALYYIAEIISHFDIVALQEIRADLKEFYELKKILGPSWSYLSTDVTDGDPGNGERMVFLYNRNKVHFSSIVGELTLKEGGKIRAAFGERIKLEKGLKVKIDSGQPTLSGTYSARIKTVRGIQKLNADLEIPLPSMTNLELPLGSKIVIKKGSEVISPERGKAKVIIPRSIHGEKYRLRFPENSFDDSLRQFARTPFLISFQAGWLKINLCTVHIYYGDTSALKLEQRRSEIEQLTAALAKKANNEFKQDSESFLGVLGDFNIIGKDHPTMEALESNGFEIPEALKSIPGSNVARDKAYDQIAFWKPERITKYARLEIQAANIFDYFEHVFRLDEEAIYRAESPSNGLKPSGTFKTWRTYKMSDHLPMWIELRTDFSAAYLKQISED